MNAYDDFKKTKLAAGQTSFSFMGGPARQAFDTAAKAIPGALVQGAALGGTAAVMGGAGVAVRKIYDAMTKKHDFENMLDNNEDLRAPYSENPKRFNLMFSTLRSMNPSFSKDPLVAGSYMRRMADSPLSAGAIAVETLNHRDTMSSPLSDMVMRGSLEGVKNKLK